MTAKIMKEIESIKITLATLMAMKLDWRLAVTIFGAALAFVYVEMSDQKEQIAHLRVEVAVVKTNQEQTREIAEENSKMLEENSRKLDMIIMQNELLLGGRNATTDEIPVDAPSSDAGNTPAKINVDTGGGACYITPLILTPNTNTPIPNPTNPTKENHNVSL